MLLKNVSLFWCKSLSHTSFRKAVNDYTLRTHTCGQLRLRHIGEKAKICGWLEFSRMDRFLVIRDAYGRVQARIPEDRVDLLQRASKINYESVITLEGVVASRGKNRNPRMPTEIVNETPPMLPYSLKTPHEMDKKYRYLELRSEDLQKNLRLRSDVVHAMRKFLKEVAHFVEVETPTLFRCTPGGANEFIVPASKPNRGLFYSLPQSPQQFKQLLMCAGLDRYYQIARCYRDETLKSDRQLEFTQVDVELSFTTQNGVMELIENLIAESWPSTLEKCRPDFPFKRLTYTEAYNDYGSDKPDLRVPWKIRDFLLDLPFIRSKATSKDVAKYFIARNCKKFVTDEIQSEWRRLIKMNASAEDFEIIVPFSSVWAQDLQIKDFIKKKNLKKDDVIAVAWGKYAGVQWTLGNLLRLIADKSGIKATENFNFVWITDFPLFTYNNETKMFESVHHPFTAPIPSHESRLYDPTQLENIIAQHYDLVLNGVELGGGSIRVHNSEVQRYIIEHVLGESADQLEHLLSALSFGAPPHGGFALGLDRYIALLAGKGNPNKPIRDVIAFPKTKDGKDAMSRSPTQVSEEILDRYGIAALKADADES